MAVTFIEYLKAHKDEITMLLSMCALLVSISAFVRPWIKDRRDRKTAVFLALQEDRKAIAVVTMRVINGDWDERIQERAVFRKRLIQSLAIAVGLEGSDRGKAYALAALVHISRLDARFLQEIVAHLSGVKDTFEAYANTGADKEFATKRLAPLKAILQSMAGPVTQ